MMLMQGAVWLASAVCSPRDAALRAAAAAWRTETARMERTLGLDSLAVLLDELADGGQDAALGVHQLLQRGVGKQLRQLADGPGCARHQIGQDALEQHAPDRTQRQARC